MPAFITAKVAVKDTTYSFDKEFSYMIPSNLEESCIPGIRVSVPFGKGNKRRQGLILEISKGQPPYRQLKPINEVLEREPLLNQEMIGLVRFMKERYFCTLFDAVSAMIPAGMQYGTVVSYELSRDIPPRKREGLTEEEIRLIDFLAAKPEPIRKDRLLKQIGSAENYDILTNLERKGIIIKRDEIKRRANDATVRMLRLADENASPALTKRQREVYDLLREAKVASQKEIMYYTGVTATVINSLFKKGLVEIFDNEVYRMPYELENDNCKVCDINLTEEQSKAFESLKESYRGSNPAVSLLYGVTGSGKTSVFMKLIDEVVSDDKGVILMVPEIALTSQMINLFKGRYGDKVAVLHSGLSMGERFDEYKRVKKNEAKIVIGTRSAVFAPMENLGLIVIDEEQEHTYKSEQTPRFHARDIAKFRVNYHKTLLVLSSATPSLESYYNAKSGKYSLSVLKSRYGNAALPKVKVVDMNEETGKGNTGTLSGALLEGIEQSVKEGKQAILLLNRRGYHTFVRCCSCREIITCPNCSISMTYHSANNRLMCHYCGYSVELPKRCPSCHEEALSYGGAGTQKLEEELKGYFPKARILRVDADSTMTKFSHAEKFRKFKDKKYDIMIGTQMVSKGLDFADVNLVGVINADGTLYSDDFRSYERAFDLITQVVGRSGRRNAGGTATIQTYTPENTVIQLASDQDYNAFYDAEISIRKSMLYPPFADICVVGFSGIDRANTFEAASVFFEMIKQSAVKDKSLPIRMFRVSAAGIMKVSSKYRYKIVLKTVNSRRFRDLMSNLLVEFSKDKRFAEVSVFADINPYNIM